MSDPTGNVFVDAKDDPGFFSEFSDVPTGRLSKKHAEVVVSEDSQAKKRRKYSSKWGDAPTVKNQISEMPDTVRLDDPVSKVFELSDPEQLAAFNRIQSKSADTESPSVLITEMDRQFYKGKWSVFVTYCKVKYQQL